MKEVGVCQVCSTKRPCWGRAGAQQVWKRETSAWKEPLQVSVSPLCVCSAMPSGTSGMRGEVPLGYLLLT